MYLTVNFSILFCDWQLNWHHLNYLDAVNSHPSGTSRSLKQTQFFGFCCKYYLTLVWLLRCIARDFTTFRASNSMTKFWMSVHCYPIEARAHASAHTPPSTPVFKGQRAMGAKVNIGIFMWPASPWPDHSCTVLSLEPHDWTWAHSIIVYYCILCAEVSCFIWIGHVQHVEEQQCVCLCDLAVIKSACIGQILVLYRILMCMHTVYARLWSMLKLRGNSGYQVTNASVIPVALCWNRL